MNYEKILSKIVIAMKRIFFIVNFIPVKKLCLFVKVVKILAYSVKNVNKEYIEITNYYRFRI